MPGMIFHMMVYARLESMPILAALNDAAGVTGCLRWRETHDREIFQRFSEYMLGNGGDDVYKAMENHLAVDEAMHGPQSPLYSYMLAMKGKLTEIKSLHTSEENYDRLAELIVETSLDGVVKEKHEDLFDIIEQSQKELDLDRVSFLLADFFSKDRRELRQGLGFLKDIDFKEVAYIGGLAKAWLGTYESAMSNLSRFEPPELFKPWYDYLKQCFTNLEPMKNLKQLDEESRFELRQVYGDAISIDFDFHGS